MHPSNQNQQPAQDGANYQSVKDSIHASQPQLAGTVQGQPTAFNPPTQDQPRYIVQPQPVKGVAVTGNQNQSTTGHDLSFANFDDFRSVDHPFPNDHPTDTGPNASTDVVTNYEFVNSSALSLSPQTSPNTSSNNLRLVNTPTGTEDSFYHNFALTPSTTISRSLLLPQFRAHSFYHNFALTPSTMRAITNLPRIVSPASQNMDVDPNQPAQGAAETLYRIPKRQQVEENSSYTPTPGNTATPSSTFGDRLEQDAAQREAAISLAATLLPGNTTNRVPHTPPTIAAPQDDSLQSFLWSAASLTPARNKLDSRLVLTPRPADGFPKVNYDHSMATYHNQEHNQLTDWINRDQTTILSAQVYGENVGSEKAVELTSAMNSTLNNFLDIEPNIVQVSPANPENKALPPPPSFIITEMTPEQRKAVLEQEYFSCELVSFQVRPITPTIPRLHMCLRGFTANALQQISNTVRETIRNSRKAYELAVPTIHEDTSLPPADIYRIFNDICDAITVDILIMGSQLAPRYVAKVKMPPITRLADKWIKWRDLLRSLEYKSSSAGTGVAVEANGCPGCHGADHPQGLCPFPNIPGWKGPPSTARNNHLNDQYHQITLQECYATPPPEAYYNQGDSHIPAYENYPYRNQGYNQNNYDNREYQLNDYYINNHENGYSRGNNYRGRGNGGGFRGRRGGRPARRGAGWV